MLPWLTTVVVVLAVGYGVLAAWYALRNRLVDDRLLIGLGLLEVAVLVQTVVGLVLGIRAQGDFERAVFFAYLLTVPVVGPLTTFLALKEKTRWSMGVVVGGAFVVAVLTGRLVQVWSPVA